MTDGFLRWTLLSMGPVRFYLSLITILNAICSSVYAADFNLYRLGAETEQSLIFVKGEIEAGDDLKLKELIGRERTPPLIIFNSPGGNLQASLRIGGAIRAAGSNTLVEAQSLCASGCALAWLAGRVRIAHPTAKIALHAASKGGSGEVTAAGNALIGAYMSQLGLGQEAIIFATSAEPSDLNYLTFQTARSLGIEVANMADFMKGRATREKAMGDDDPHQRVSRRCRLLRKGRQMRPRCRCRLGLLSL